MYKGPCPQVSGRSPPCHLILNRLTMFPEPPLDARDYHTSPHKDYYISMCSCPHGDPSLKGNEERDNFTATPW